MLIKKSYIILFFMLLGMKSTFAFDTNQEALRTLFFEAAQKGDTPMIKKVIADGLDLHNDDDIHHRFEPLHDILHVYESDYQKTAEMIEVLFQAGAVWPFTLEDTLIIEGREIMRMETMTQNLKSHVMLNQDMPKLKLYFKQLIPLVDAMELKYGKKNASDIHFYAKDLTDIERENSNVEASCKYSAYRDLWHDIEYGYIDDLKATIGLGVNLNFVSKDETALGHAFMSVPFFPIDKAWEIIRLLLDGGARTFNTNPCTMTRFMAVMIQLLEKKELDDVMKQFLNNCRQLAVLLDTYELEHKLKTTSDL